MLVTEANSTYIDFKPQILNAILRRQILTGVEQITLHDVTRYDWSMHLKNKFWNC
jgi:hypothetical protein